MKLILKCCTSHDETFGCDYALVDLTPRFARRMLKLIALVRRNKKIEWRHMTVLHEMRFWNRDACYFSPWPHDPETAVTKKKSEWMEELLGDDEVCIMDDAFEIPEAMLANTECDQMLVRDDNVGFNCYAKHTSVIVTTASIPKDLIRRAAEEK